MAGQTTRVSSNGRVVIPAEIRREAGLEPGDELVVRVEDGRIELETRANLLRRIQARWRAAGKGGGMVDELIAERRREAAELRRELEEWDKRRSSTHPH
jgi:AbrB family looped-hinge helix DNA binding protein